MTDPLSTHVLNPDTQAVLLLCGRIGRSAEGEAKPLTQSEYDRLALWLRDHEMRPADLLADTGLLSLQGAADLPVDMSRLASLLERGGAMALAVEGWTNKGLWVISRSDPQYPRRLKVGRIGPPLLYGVGDAELLLSGGMAIVGSRDAGEAALDFTRRVARACAEGGITVVSGGARGVDKEAMLAALEAGGVAVGVLSDSLAKEAVSGKYRQGFVEKRLALVSPYDPNAGFDVGNAMGRNKHIYGLADYALVVSATHGKGGTWAGAKEALKKEKTPVYVWAGVEGGGISEGNKGLVELGARPFPEEPWTDLAQTLSGENVTPYPVGPTQGMLLFEPKPEPYSQ